MPVFHIRITLANGTRYSEYRDEEAELDDYYRQMWDKAKAAFGSGLATFDVQQLSRHSPISQYMHSVGLKKLPQRKG